MTRKKSKSKRSQLSKSAVAKNQAPVSPIPGLSRSSRTPPGASAEFTRIEEHHFSGPLPPPNVLEQYNAILPGAAERIIAMAENQTQHRQELEKSVVLAQIKDDGTQRGETRLGQIFGFLIAIVAIGASVACLWFSPNTAGAIPATAIGGGGVAGLVYAFRYGKRVSNQQPPSDSDASS